MNYYTRINRSVSGPISEQELLKQIRAKTISMLDEVSTDGVNWRRLGTLPIYHGVSTVPAATPSQENARAAVAPAEPEERSASTNHLYCEKCGHDWYSPRWDDWCPKCRNRGRRYAVPEAGESEVRASGTYHLYCDKCGHEWYSNRWDTYCPKGGCTGRARKYAVPEAPGGQASRRRRAIVIGVLAAIAAFAALWLLSSPGKGGKGGGTGPSTQTGATSNGRRFAVIVGVGEMDEKSWGGKNALDAPAQNVKLINAILVGKGGFAQEDVQFLWNGAATHGAVRKAVRDAAAKARPGDTFVFYFSGHGGQWGNRNQTFLCTYDIGPERGKEIGYTDKELNDDFSRFPRGVVVSAILQACHSGGVMTALGVDSDAQWNPADFAASVTALRNESKGIRDGEIAPIGWITAADATHSSWGGTDGSAFTICFAASAWTGKCDANGDGMASFAEAWRYAKDELAKDPKHNSFPQCSDVALCEKIRIPVRKGDNGLSELDVGEGMPDLGASAESGAISDFLSPTESDIVKLFAQVRDSSAVAGNSKHQHVAAGIDCHVVEDDSLNAYAHWKRLESGARIREICYHTGHARFDRVVGAIAGKTLNKDGSDEEREKAMWTLVLGIPKALKESRFRIDEKTAKALLATAGVSERDFAQPGFIDNARKVADGIALSTLSHEMGHHLLGHLDMDFDSVADKAFDRTLEDQADSFASSVMVAANNKENRRQMFMGRFFWSLIVASTEKGDSDEDRSHPLTKRRLRNLIEADPETSRELGVSVETADKMVEMVAAILNDKGDAPNNSASTSETYHLYCDKCGHEWYSSRWDTYCPKWGCTGRAKRY